MALVSVLDDRGVVRITGPERVAFLQGLLSNDIDKATPSQAIWAALLTAQGKYLHDMFVVVQGDALLLEGERARLPDLMQRLKLYKLRSQIEITDLSGDFDVAVAWGDGAAAAFGLEPSRGRSTGCGGGGVAFIDPRLSAAGVRLLLPRQAAVAALAETGLASADRRGWDRLRMELGLPDGSRDMEVEKALLLENGFDELGGCDWRKGCYVGQELTARTKYRGLVKRRLLPVRIDGQVPPPGTLLFLGEIEAGEMRSADTDRGLALLRLDALAESMQSGQALSAGSTRLVPHKPDWVAA